MKLENVRELFEYIGVNKEEADTSPSSVKQRQNTGIKTFKRRVLGLCGKQRTMTIDELANILLDLNMANTIFNARGLVFEIEGHKLAYGEKYIRAERVKIEKQTFYRVMVRSLY